MEEEKKKKINPEIPGNSHFLVVNIQSMNALFLASGLPEDL